MNVLLRNPLTSGLAIVLLILLAWAVRIDRLRARHLEIVRSVSAALIEADFVNPEPAKFAGDVRFLASDRRRIRAEREAALIRIEAQNTRVAALAAEGARLGELARANTARVAGVIAERDRWIAVADAASDRTELRSAEAEIGDLNATLDAFYRDGF